MERKVVLGPEDGSCSVALQSGTEQGIEGKVVLGPEDGIYSGARHS